ncbi:MAG: zinc-binding dehydrogenase [Halioglobus sp.]|nr:zinc-binding dehydrogenase [Halioglobus sp.]
MTTSHRWQFDAYNTPAEALAWCPQALAEPGPGQVLLKILAVGMNRSEFNYVQGNYAPARAFPSGIGQEAVGEILAIGPAAVDGPQPHAKTPLTVGSRVALLPGRVDMCEMGTYSDVGLFDQAALAPVPDTYTDAEAAGLWMGVLTMAGALELAGITPQSAKGKTVLITAASSSMGVIGLKLAKTWGATTIASSRSAAKAEQLAAFCDHTIVADDSDSLIAGVADVTDKAGFDAALDPVGQAFYPGLIQGAATGASIISYEMITGREPILPIPLMMMKDLTLRGYTIFRPYRVPGLLTQIIDWGMAYADQIKPIVAGTRSLSEAPKALEELGRCEHLGKLVLTSNSTN